MKNKSRQEALRPYAPRKTPTQKRSQILYDNILSTANVMFAQQGYAYVSTNQIAEAANISIGSLYQYFANCESIALAIYEEASAKAALKMKQTAIDIMGLPIEESVSAIISTLIDIFEADRFALLQLIDEVPELRASSQPMSFDNLIHRTTQAYLEQNYPLADKDDIVCKVYVAEKSVIGTIRRYLEEEAEVLDREKIIAELAGMIVGYLSALAHSTIRR